VIQIRLLPHMCLFVLQIKLVHNVYIVQIRIFLVNLCVFIFRLDIDRKLLRDTESTAHEYDIRDEQFKKSSV
jgi:hypothetical protein